MRVGTLIARILLGIIFLVFGLNGFLHFIPMPPPPGLAGQFFGILFASPYYTVIFGVQVIAGVLFLAGRYVTLALVIIGPVIVNIWCFHLFMAHTGFPLPLVVTVLWVILAMRNTNNLAGIFAPRSA